MEDDAPARDRAAAGVAESEIAGLLERRLGASGSSLPALLRSAGEAVPEAVAAKIQLIEACRKELTLHEDTVLADRAAFERAVTEVVAFLSRPAQSAAAGAPRRRSGAAPRRALAVGLLVVAIALIGVAVWGIVNNG